MTNARRTKAWSTTTVHCTDTLLALDVEAVQVMIMWPNPSQPCLWVYTRWTFYCCISLKCAMCVTSKAVKYIDFAVVTTYKKKKKTKENTSTESGFFSVRCTPEVSTFRTWLLFRNSPYKCLLVYARGEISLSLRNKLPDFLCCACTMKTDIFTVTKNWFSQHDIWSSDQWIASSV